MTVLLNGFENETTGAAFVSGAGGSSGSAVNTVTIAGTGAVTVSTAHPAKGTKGLYFFANGGSDKARAFWSWTAADSCSAEFYVYFATLPSQAQRFFSFINATTFNEVANLQFNASNALQMVDATGTAHTFGVLFAATLYRFEVGITKGTTTSNGVWQAAYYLGDSATAVDSFSATARNVETNQIIEGEIGSNAAASKLDAYFDAVWFDNTQNTYLGPPTTSIPVATIESRPAPQLTGTVTVTGNVSCASGTVKTANVLIVSGPNNPTVTQGRSGLNVPSCDLTSTFTGAPGRYVVKVTGTNDLDQTVATEPTQIIDVYPDTDVDVKPYQRLTGADTIYGGAATVIGALTDSNSATGVEGVTGPVGETEWLEWCSYGPGDIKFPLMHYQTPAVPVIRVQVTVFREDGISQLHDETVDAPTVLGSESIITLSPAEMLVLNQPDLTDRRALRTRTIATTTGIIPTKGVPMPVADLPAPGGGTWVHNYGEDFTGADLPIGSFDVDSDGVLKTTCSAYSRFGSKFKTYPDATLDTYGITKNYSIRTLAVHDNDANANGVLDVYFHTETISSVVTPLAAWIRPLMPGDNGHGVNAFTEQLYGRYAFRMRAAPGAAGYGWAALTITDPWPDNGEQDFWEGPSTGNMGGFFHYANPAGGQVAVAPLVAKPNSGWHDVVAEWSPGLIKWYYDGELVLNTTSQVPAHTHKFVLQSGAAAPGVTPGSLVTGHWLIDWVSVWKYQP